jgi:hypothetical protein
MKIGKPLLLVTTPLGLAIGLWEGYKLTGGLVVLLFVLIAGFGAAIAMVVSTVRSETRAARLGQHERPRRRG